MSAFLDEVQQHAVSPHGAASLSGHFFTVLFQLLRNPLLDR